MAAGHPKGDMSGAKESIVLGAGLCPGCAGTDRDGRRLWQAGAWAWSTEQGAWSQT